MPKTTTPAALRLQIRLRPDESRRVLRRAAERDQSPNDYARDRVLRRLRPTVAQRVMGEKAPECLDRLLHYIREAAKLGLHLAPTLPAGSEPRRAAEMLDQAFDVAEGDIQTLRALIRDAALP